MEHEKWVQLSYDSNPDKRYLAAKHMANSSSPFAMFALLELLSDKDEKVRTYVRQILKQKKETKNESGALLSNLLIHDFAAVEQETEKLKKSEEDEIKFERIKEKIEPIIEDWIEAQNPDKRKLVKKKLMPMVDQIIKRWADKEEYLMQMLYSEIKHKKPGHKIEKMPSIGGDNDAGKYLEMILSAEKIAHGNDIDLPEISESAYDEQGLDHGMRVLEEEDEKDNPFIDAIERSIYNRAIKIVTMPGITKKKIKEMRTDIKKEIQLKVNAVFKLAEMRAGRREIEWLDELKDGMTKVHTKEVEVISVEDREIKPARGRSKHFKRLVLSDGQHKFPLYLWKGRGDGILKGERIRLENAIVETYPATGETALTVKGTKSSSIIVIK